METETRKLNISVNSSADLNVVSYCSFRQTSPDLKLLKYQGEV